MIKSRNAYKLDLEKQRLKLKMKEQELEIKKSLLQLKAAFSPLQYAGRMFFESVDDNAVLASGEASETELKAIAKRKRKRAMMMKQISDLFINFILILETYLGTISGRPSGSAQNIEKAEKEEEE
ncbi:MAG: hypothetical protein IPM47_03925 [Sphingobacteriales bacterium]|nr:MAG: hypothetical protein IPM47_03925 [Sphingobacteriales bacterium]